MTSELTIPTICKNCGHAFRSHKQRRREKIIQCGYCDCREFSPA